MLADEARAAVRAAEVASEAAQKAHEAAQYFLEGLEAASSGEPGWELQPRPDRVRKRQSAAKPAQQNESEQLLFDESPLFAAVGQPDEDAQRSEPEEAHAMAREYDAATSESDLRDWPVQASNVRIHPSADDAYAADTVEPIYANLIQFPRELIATRKVRPRRAEGPLAATDGEPQLSIFEVDPEVISTEPMATATNHQEAPVWMRPEWRAIELERQPGEEFHREPELRASPMTMELAPVSRRLMAIAVDGALIMAAFLAVAMEAVTHVKGLPGPRAIEVASAFAVLAFAAAYLTTFFSLTKATPGMWYAGIRLRTFDGLNPTRAERCRRLVALLLSVLPLGLGLAWALFDADHLTWHDRLSGTYLHRR